MKKNICVVISLLFIFILFSLAWGINPNAPPSLKTSIVPLPPDLDKYVRDRDAAIRLGKALFWDMQVGSDGVTACATCHFHAGTDSRVKNVINPGLRAGDNSFDLGSLSETLRPYHFPLHKRQQPVDRRTSPILSDTNDVISSPGVRLSKFLGIINGFARERIMPLTDSLFNINGIRQRQVVSRNSGTVINAVFNFSNFWDGRANNIFNGVNPFGPMDTSAKIYFNNNGTLEERVVRLQDASLASQAVGPPLSEIEMSAIGRTFPDLGKKLLLLRPLAKQIVHPDDSVLGNYIMRPPFKGLRINYKQMIQEAFHPEFWDYQGVITFNGKQYSQMEMNFSLFFGISIMLYESTLVSDDTPFDRFQEGDSSALTLQQQRGLDIFLNQGGCIFCHGGPEFTLASVASVKGLIPPRPGERPHVGPIELMEMSDGTQAFYDVGFYNIAVSTEERDVGRDNTAPFINPLTGEPYPLSLSKLSVLKQNGLLPPEVSEYVPDLPGILPGNRTAVRGSIKTPTLRNVELTGPYMHNGSMSTLRQVIDFYTRGGNFPVENFANMDPDISEIGHLINRDDRKNDLIAFLLALTDERVRNESAPFDHPEILIPFSSNQKNLNSDQFIRIPAVGRFGRLAQGLQPLQPFMGLDPFDPGGVFSVSGNVTYNGVPLANVIVSLTNGTDNFNTMTNDSGHFIISGITNGNYTINFEKVGYDFSPKNLNIVVNNINLDNINSVAILVPIFKISGKITNKFGFPVPNITVNLTGTLNQTATTDSSGVYTFTGLTNGSYTIKPAKTGYIFTPFELVVTVDGNDLTGLNFIQRRQ